MARGYSHDGYNVKQNISFEPSGALNGTRAAAVELQRMTWMHPVRLLDFNVYMVAGGTQSNVSLILGKSLGGTGAITGIGTQNLGTQATGTVIDSALTETNFVTGDDITLEVSLGTATTVPNGQVYFCYRENFVETDS